MLKFVPTKPLTMAREAVNVGDQRRRQNTRFVLPSAALLPALQNRDGKDGSDGLRRRVEEGSVGMQRSVRPDPCATIGTATRELLRLELVGAPSEAPTGFFIQAESCTVFR